MHSEAEADAGGGAQLDACERKTTLTLRSLGSFHDISRWDAALSGLEEASTRDAALSGHEDVSAPARRLANPRGSLKWLTALSPEMLGDESGNTLSTSGVAIITGAAAAMCHAVRLVLRDLLEPWARSHGTKLSAVSWRTLELYLLSLLHSGAWVGFALRSLVIHLARYRLRHGSSAVVAPAASTAAGSATSTSAVAATSAASAMSAASAASPASASACVHSSESGAARALGLSAGYHLYVLLQLRSVWTHPLVTLHHLGELVGLSSQLRSHAIGRQAVALFGGLRALPTLALSALSALEHLGEPNGSAAYRTLARVAAPDT